MSIEQTDIVDAIGEDELGNIILTISDHLDWSSDNKHLFLLQDKINLYLAFLESGEVYRSYLNSKGKKFIIDVVFKYQPKDKDIQFLLNISNIVAEAGFRFTWSVIDSDQSITANKSN